MRIGLTYTLRLHDAAAADTGGWNDAEEEFDSEQTVEAIAGGLRSLGHEVELLGDGEPLLRRLLSGERPDLVFNFAEGRGTTRSREAWVPAVLEMLGIPFCGSDPLTLAVTLDKDVARRLAASAGVAVPRAVTVTGALDSTTRELLRELPYPVIVKPACEGSSKGIVNASVVDDPEALFDRVEMLWVRYAQPVLVEEYIKGDELTVGLVGGKEPRLVGVMRVLPRRGGDRFVYGLETKRNWRQEVEYEIPARLAPADMDAVQEAARRAWTALGCRDVSRVDFRLRDGVPYFLEVNPLPGLNPESGDIVLTARAMGWSYEGLLGAIVEAAALRTGIRP